MAGKTGRRGHNEGSIYQRADGRWVGAVHLGWDPTGRKRKVVYGRTRAEVSLKITRLLADRQRGLPIQTSDKLVSVFLNEWLEDVVRKGRSASTYTTYRSMIETHIKPAIGKHHLSKLTQQHIQAMLNNLAVSASTARLVRSIVRAALRQAMEWDLVGRNVAALTKSPKGEQFEGYALSPDEVRNVMATVSGDDLEALYAIATSVGLRQAELLGLRWGNIDREAGTVTVRHQLKIVDGEPTFAELKTKSSRRTITLAPSVLAILRNHYRRQLECRLRADGWQDHQIVFSFANGRPLRPDEIRKHWKVVKERAGIPAHVRFHDLRHSALTIMASRGVPPGTLKHIAGHATIATTMQVYTHPDAENMRTATGLMGDLYEAKNMSI